MNQALIDETITELYRMHGVDLTSDYAAKIRKIHVPRIYGDEPRNLTINLPII